MKRRLAKLLLFLLLGAIVNVAVAWGCAAFLDPTTVSVSTKAAEFTDDAHGFWELERAQRLGMLVLVNRRVHNSESLLSIIPQEVVSGNVDELLPSWGDLDMPHGEFAPGERALEERFTIAAGWPCLALWCDLYWFIGEGIGTPRLEPRGAISLNLAPWKGIIRRALPLRLIWPGYAINTIFYAAITWMLFAAPGTIRRWHRLKRGLCAGCGYPVGESATCSECGEPVASRGVAPI